MSGYVVEGVHVQRSTATSPLCLKTQPLNYLQMSKIKFIQIHCCGEVLLRVSDLVKQCLGGYSPTSRKLKKKKSLHDTKLSMLFENSGGASVAPVPHILSPDDWKYSSV